MTQEILCAALPLGLAGLVIGVVCGLIWRRRK